MPGYRQLTLGAALLVLLAGCDGDSGPKPDAAKPKPKPPATAKVKQPADQKPRAEYRYDSTGKADPFLSFVSKLRAAAFGAASTPLERFDLSQLTVTGILWGAKTPRALIKDPSGKAYVVAAGSLIGRNDGRIMNIADGAVTVKETYVDFLGKATTKDIRMQLHEKQGG